MLLLMFVLVSVAATGFGLVLGARQAAYVARHRDAVPPGFADAVSLAQHQRAADYERARLRLEAADSLFALAVALSWACFGYDALYGWAGAWIPSGLSRGVAFLVMAGALSWALDLPFAVLRTFGVEQRFGFNRTSPGAFALDRLKGATLTLGLGVPLLYGLLWLMRRPGPWWAWAWLGTVLLMLALTDAYPRWIAPLFNRFVPLEGPLRARIEGLLHRCGFEASGLFIMDASRRSAHGNAYFSGLGRSKRIVLFDTLIAGNSEAELEAVLAHELGHFKLKHVLIGLLQTAGLLFVAFFATGWLCKQPWLLPSFGITHRDDALALIVLPPGGPDGRAAPRHRRQLDQPASRVPGRRLRAPHGRRRADDLGPGATVARQRQHADHRPAVRIGQFQPSPGAAARAAIAGCCGGALLLMIAFSESTRRDSSCARAALRSRLRISWPNSLCILAVCFRSAGPYPLNSRMCSSLRSAA